MTIPHFSKLAMMDAANAAFYEKPDGNVQTFEEFIPYLARCGYSGEGMNRYFGDRLGFEVENGPSYGIHRAGNRITTISLDEKTIVTYGRPSLL
jgi:hypothetical protein